MNEIKQAIAHNEPIEEKLHVIAVISNPCLYKRRYILFKEFVERMETEENNVILYIVELIYAGQEFVMTDAKNPQHLQLVTETPLWHKENMINVGVQKLLPVDYKAFAWIDGDLEFESNTWALDTLKILNGCKDIVQLFSHLVDMSDRNTDLSIFNGFGYSFTKKKSFCKGGIDYWHPGYAWAITRKAYEQIGGLYEEAILGSGDNIMALGLIKKCEEAINPQFNIDYKNSILNFQEKADGLRLGYTPGVIRHHYHGTKANRRYTERQQILIKHQFSPIVHTALDENGIRIQQDI